MCGIAGYVGGAPPELLAAMVGALKHRGPADEGIHVEPGVGLGMTRLAIIDLVTGRQPMSTADSAAWIVFNGEIYNFRALRATLEARGRRFRTRSDTEVILGGYTEYGEGGVEHLRGMFAFAIWDRARGTLFLARDRLGKKPLYYWHRDGLLLFASEPKALLRHPAVSRSLDWKALHHYLAFGYTPAARSIFAGIAKVPPAHIGTLRGGRLSLRRYWRLPAGTPASVAPPFIVARAPARYVKVALSGIGGDEAFGGSPRYLGVRVSERYARLPRPLRRGLAAVAPRLVPKSRSSRNLGDWARRFVAGAEAPMPDRYIGWTRFFDDDRLGRLATPALPAELAGPVDAVQRSAFAASGHRGPVDGAFRIDLETYLRDDLLTMADRMSMAHSLELRAPFCDHQLIEASLAMPPTTKIPGLRLKGLLKTAFAPILPAPVLSHRKQGFMIPLGDWLKTDLRGTLEELLAPDQVRARGLFEPAEVERLKAEHLAGARTHADRLWTLMMAELWIREYQDQHGTWTLR